MGPRENDMEKDSYVMDGYIGSFENGASYADLQIFYDDQIDFTSGKRIFTTFFFIRRKIEIYKEARK